MSQQQQYSDSWTNSNQSSWCFGNGLALARARSDVLARAALIIRARALLEEAMVPPATPVRSFLIDIDRSRLAKRMAITLTVTLTQPPSP